MTVGNRILQLTTSRLTGNKEQLAHAEGLLPIAARNAVERAQSRLRNAATTLSGISGRRLQPQLTRLDNDTQSHCRCCIEPAYPDNDHSSTAARPFLKPYPRLPP